MNMYFHDEGSAHIGHNKNFQRENPFPNERAEYSFGKANRKNQRVLRMKHFQEDKSDYFFSGLKQFDDNIHDKVADSKQYMDVKRKKIKPVDLRVKRR